MLLFRRLSLARLSRHAGQVALTCSILSCLFEPPAMVWAPHWAGPNGAGFASLFWQFFQRGVEVLFVIGLVGGAVASRTWRGRVALLVSIGNAVWFWYLLRGWLPDF